MRNSRWLLGLAVALAVRAASAQVDIEVSMSHDSYIPGETTPLTVRVANHSGQTLRFSKGEHWLNIVVHGEHDSDVVRERETPLPDLALDSAKVALVHIDLGPDFDFQRLGHYTVTAELNVKDWGRSFTSDPQTFEIIAGIKVWEQDFGLPMRASTNHDEPRMRKYTLVEARYSNQRKLFCRVTDDTDSEVYRVVEVGPTTSFSRLDPRVDRRGTLHLLYQSGPRVFSYTEIIPTGEVVVRQTYDYTESGPPFLKVDDAGHFSVQGGVRRLATDDLPASSNDLSLDAKQEGK